MAGPFSSVLSYYVQDRLRGRLGVPLGLVGPISRPIFVAVRLPRIFGEGLAS